MNGVHGSPDMRGSDQFHAVSDESSGYIDPFLLDLPTANPADLPALTLDPLTVRCIRDRSDPTSSHRTRRNK